MDLLPSFRGAPRGQRTALSWVLSSDIRLRAGFASANRLMLMGFYAMTLSKQRVTFMVTTEQEALEGLVAAQPGVLILTPQLDQGSGLALVERARSVVRDIRTILLVNQSDDWALNVASTSFGPSAGLQRDGLAGAGRLYDRLGDAQPFDRLPEGSGGRRDTRAGGGHEIGQFRLQGAQDPALPLGPEQHIGAALPPIAPDLEGAVQQPQLGALTGAHHGQIRIDRALPAVGEHVRRRLGGHEPAAFGDPHAAAGELDQGEAALR